MARFEIVSTTMSSEEMVGVLRLDGQLDDDRLDQLARYFAKVDQSKFAGRGIAPEQSRSLVAQTKDLLELLEDASGEDEHGRVGGKRV